MDHDGIKYIDDDKTPLKRIIETRIPSLGIGMMLGFALSFIVSRFENVLSENIQLVFFLPFIVYISDAIGAQTRDIYVRDLKSGKASFKKYLVKETSLGIFLGVASGILVGSISYIWLGSPQLSLAIALGMSGAIVIAPLIALIVAEVLELEHHDPAVGSGPIATIIQDTLSVVIYGLIASAIVL